MIYYLLDEKINVLQCINHEKVFNNNHEGFIVSCEQDRRKFVNTS